MHRYSVVVVMLLIFVLYESSEFVGMQCVRIYLNDLACQKLERNASPDLCNHSGAYRHIGYHPMLKEANFSVETGRLAGNLSLLSRLTMVVSSLISCLLLGSLSVLIGRQRLLMAPISGLTILSVLIGLSYHISLSVDVQIMLVFFVLLLHGIGGRGKTVTLLTTAYLVDVTPEEHRTMVTALALGVNFFGQLSGSALFFAVQRYTILSHSAIILGCSMAICVILLIISYSTLPEKSSKVAQKHNNGMSLCEIMRNVCYFLRNTPKDMPRWIFFAPFVFLAVNQGLANLETDLFLPATLTRVFGNSYHHVAMFLLIKYASLTVVGIAVMPLVQYFFNLSDATFMVAGLAMLIANYVTLGLCHRKTVALAANVFAGGAILIGAGQKALVTRRVEQQQMGVCFAVITTFETLGAIIGSGLGAMMFNFTIELYSNAVYLVLAIVALIYLLVIFVMQRKGLLSHSA